MTTDSAKEFRNGPLIPYLLALFIGAVALALSDNYVDGDAHTRTYMALQWLKNPFFINAPNQVTWVFGPLHCYLNALVLWIWHNPPLATRVLSLVLTTLTIFPLFYSVEKAFGRREAFYTSLLFCFYTLFIHPAAIAASEGINLLFVFTSICFYLYYHQSGKTSHLLLSALAVLLASMMRYESWLLAPFFTLLLMRDNFAFHFKKVTYARYRPRWWRVVLYGLISGSFIVIWIGSCLIEFGDPVHFLHYSGNLDAPVIAKKLQESGALKLMVYNLAFLPGVMFLSFPFTSFLLALGGAFSIIRQNRNNIFLWLFGLFLLFYLVIFVFSFERFPLARFTTVPGAIFFCFIGTGLVRFLTHVKTRLVPIIMATLLIVSAANMAILGTYNTPSEQPIAEKLRAVSPITRQPDYFYETAAYCNNQLSVGSDLVLDCRNYNDRLLYLSLYQHFDKINHHWRDNKHLTEFISDNRQKFVLHTKYPRRNHEVFLLSDDGVNALIGGVSYIRAASFGIFTLYQLKTSESIHVLAGPDVRF